VSAEGATTSTVAHVLGTGRIGGTEVNTLRLLGPLSSRGVSSVVVTVSNDSDFVFGECQKLGVPFMALGFPPIGSLSRVLEFMSEHDVDIIHAYGLRASMVGKVIRLRSRSPLFVGIRGNGLLSGAKGLVEGLTSPLVSKYVCNSLAAKKALAGLTVIPDDKIVSIPNGIDFDWPPIVFRETTAPVIATVANFTPQKNYELMLRCIHEVRTTEHAVQYRVAGDGPLRREIEAQIGHLAVESSVTMYGMISDVNQFLTDADIFLFISRAEGFPNAVMEAMLKGIPVVASRTGGIPELIQDGVSGLLVGGLDEAVAAVLRLCRDPGLRKALGMNARDRVKSVFTLTSQAEQYARLYENAIRAKEGG